MGMTTPTTAIWGSLCAGLLEVCPAIPFLSGWSRFAAILHCSDLFHETPTCNVCVDHPPFVDICRPFSAFGPNPCFVVTIAAQNSVNLFHQWASAMVVNQINV